MSLLQAGTLQLALYRNGRYEISSYAHNTGNFASTTNSVVLTLAVGTWRFLRLFLSSESDISNSCMLKPKSALLGYKPVLLSVIKCAFLKDTTRRFRWGSIPGPVDYSIKKLALYRPVYCDHKMQCGLSIKK